MGPELNTLEKNLLKESYSVLAAPWFRAMRCSVRFEYEQSLQF